MSRQSTMQEYAFRRSVESAYRMIQRVETEGWGRNHVSTEAGIKRQFESAQALLRAELAADIDGPVIQLLDRSPALARKWNVIERWMVGLR